MTIQRARELLELNNLTDDEVREIIARDKSAMRQMLNQIITQDNIDMTSKN